MNPFELTEEFHHTFDPTLPSEPPLLTNRRPSIAPHSKLKKSLNLSTASATMTPIRSKQLSTACTKPSTKPRTEY